MAARFRVVKYDNLPRGIWTHIKCHFSYQPPPKMPSLSWVSASKQTSGWTSLALIVHPHERNPEWEQRCVGEWVCSTHGYLLYKWKAWTVLLCYRFYMIIWILPSCCMLHGLKVFQMGMIEFEVQRWVFRKDGFTARYLSDLSIQLTKRGIQSIKTGGTGVSTIWIYLTEFDQKGGAFIYLAGRKWDVDGGFWF